MGKFASFAVGAGQGALATKRYQDSLSRAKKQDELLAAVLTGGMKKDPMSNTTFDPETGGTMDMTTGKVTYHPADIDDLDSQKRMRKMANGGMVQPMPQHWDKMSWQRVSFKK